MRPTNDISYLLEHVSSVLHRQSDQVLQERLGIGLSQYKILMMLQQPVNWSQRQIADSLGQTEASISRQVKLLIERGMLAVNTDPAERRKHQLRATTKGVKITHAAQDTLAEFYAPVTDVLSPKERDQLFRTLTKLHEYCCASGRPMTCNQPFTIEAVYDYQQA